VSPRVNIQRPEIIRELNNALGEFGDSLSTELSSIQREIGEVLEWIEERERHWRNEVQRCESELNAAQRAYADCITQPNDKDGRRPNCSDFAAAMDRARQARDRAQRELANVLSWKGTLRSKIALYVEQATKIQRVANQTLSQANTFLNNKSRELGDYQSVSSPNTIESLGGHRYQYIKAKQEMLLRALDDPMVGRDIKGWIRNELRRIQNLERVRADPDLMRHVIEDGGHIHNLNIRMPIGYDAGHRNHSIDHWSNLRFEDIWLNRSRYHRAVRLGVQDRIR